ncbi:hypothetical protein JEQ12_016888 [Ovis aries]|uniref:40S ribosomal protein SA-like n=1 Tax=Ovis aries TaxID=9940 RepID=A0A836A6Q8_SHEEP|nr:hypothetical protein JEQ12_016888 [Ovis aries]
MSAVLDVLQMEEGGVLKFLAVGTHVGGTNLDFQMEQYTYRRKSYGKLLLAACAIVAFENPADVTMLKFVAATGAIPITGHFSPGTFTNQIQAAFREPRLQLVTDPRADHQPLTDASYINLPTIALCNRLSSGARSVGLMWWWLQTCEFLCMCGIISWEHPWEVMPDLCFYRAEKAVTKEEFQSEWTARFIHQFICSLTQRFPTEDWSAQPATAHWSVAPTCQATEWVEATTEWS